MTTLMYDSIRVAGLPSSALIVAGYLDGTYANWAELTAKFPGVPKVAGDVNGSTPGAEFRDWETGDKGGNLEQWVIAHNVLNKNGAKDAVIYCNRSTIPEVRQLTGSQVLGKDYFLWIATGDNTLYGPSTLPGIVACQYLWTASYDVSVVWPTAGVWWTGGAVTPAKPAPKPVALPPGVKYPPVRNLKVVATGQTTVKLEWDSPEQPANAAPLPGITEYQIAIASGSRLTGPDDPSYPRTVAKGTNPEVWEGGSLAKGLHTAGVRALGSSKVGSGPWATAIFTI